MRKRLLAISLVLLATATAGRDVRNPGAAAAVGDLVGYESLQACAMPADVQRELRRAEREANAAPGRTLATAPLRNIRDTYPTFAAISVDMTRDEVVVTDENLFQILTYDRLDNTPPGVAASTPKRVISGDDTVIEFQSGVYVEQKSGDIYVANNDTRDTLAVFRHGANGNAKPMRQVQTPHGTFGVVVVEAHDELFMTTQHDSSVVVYDRTASNKQSPIRLLQGLRTELADPHGIAFDAEEDVIFVANYGATHDVAWTDTPKTGVNRTENRVGKENWPLGREFAVAGSGSINGPSITVYRRTTRGNVPPLRTIQGPNTGLNWPTGLAFDPQAHELFVANDAAHEILVFDAGASGDARPKRVIKGARTKLANPTGVFADTKNRELWVTNFGGHSATVYDLSASGDVAPKRMIRNAPTGTPSLMIGNPGAVGYDSKRETILVPN